MKKTFVIGLAALLLVAFTMPASALENKFGGYWRTRAYTNQNFTGEDQSELKDLTQVDTRTRLYYTAILNDDLKLVNKFEMDAVWGDNGYGDIGADGIKVEVKNSYADFNVGPMLNAKVGVQGMNIARGLFFSDDFAGAVISYKASGFVLPLVWMKPYEGGLGNNNLDVDYYGIAPVITSGDGTMSINPFAVWATSDNATGWGPTSAFDDVDIYYVGLNLDAKFEGGKAWFTGIYENGTASMPGTEDSDMDIKAYLLAGGASVSTGVADIHCQAVYATGDDGEDEDFETFFVPKGQSYYWAEIMGFGVFDVQGSNNAPNDQIGNIMFGNIGASVTPDADKRVTVSLDLWYAALAEDIMIGDSEENELGVEVDLMVSYQLVEGLKLDLVGAYLFAGDATTEKSDDDANPYELGSQISLSF